MSKVDIRKIPSSSGIDIYYRGPGFDKPALGSVIYFALSGPESLGLDPFNQPVERWVEAGVHVFSWTLPAHEEPGSFKDAIAVWATEMGTQQDIIGDFIEVSARNVNELISEGMIDSSRLAVAGLSRGAFVAAHLAAVEPRIEYVLGYAPLTKLGVIQEFEQIKELPLVAGLDVKKLADRLAKKHVRFYMGNRDTRVGTTECWDSIRTMVEMATSQGIRSPAIELILTPSIGYKGHGTAPEVFYDGAEWIITNFQKKLGIV